MSTHQLHPGHSGRKAGGGRAAPSKLPGNTGKIDHPGHAGHVGMARMEGMSRMGNLKRRFLVSLILAVPVVLLSPMMGMRLPFQFGFPGSEWLVLVLATALFFYGGMPFLRGARDELRARAPAMMTLVALGISVAYLYSVYAFVVNMRGGRAMDFFWELATLIVIMLLGHWLEMNAVGSAGDALRHMAELLPGVATLVTGKGTSRDIPIGRLNRGDRVLVRSGKRVPADGRVVDGESSVDESMLTGEARAVRKAIGDPVVGGSLNGSGVLTVEVSATGESGFLARVIKMVEDARSEKSRNEMLSDRVARLLFYVALAAGLAAFAVWLAVRGDVGLALQRLVTVLVIACPHALGLAVPLVVARAVSIGARHGLLIRKRAALDTAARTTAVLMDKTGTLTEGRFTVSELRSLDPGFDEDRVLSYAASLEEQSSHPLAAGVLRLADQRDVAVPVADAVEAVASAGLRGTVDGHAVALVSAAFLDTENIPYDAAGLADAAGRGDTVSYLVVDGRVVGAVAQGDRIRDGAREFVDTVKERGVTPVMLTGDNQAAAEAVARSLGIEEYQARLLPGEKEKVVRKYQADKGVVMMVGDGVNDAPALAGADVGVAIGAGTDVAVDSADVVLVRSDPADIAALLDLARKTSRKMVENLWWGAGYNIVAIPLAAGVLAHWGLVLGPAAGALLMSISTVVVAANAMTLRLGDKETGKPSESMRKR